jgi:hypothetical protein
MMVISGHAKLIPFQAAKLSVNANLKDKHIVIPSHRYRPSLPIRRLLRRRSVSCDGSLCDLVLPIMNG